MKWFMNMKIGAKLLAGFILVALIAGAMGVFAIVNIKALDKADTELYENMTVPISIMSNISTAFQRTRVNLRDMCLTEDLTETEQFKTNYEARIAEIEADSKAFGETIVSEEMTALYATFVKAKDDYVADSKMVLQFALENKNAEALALLKETGLAGIASRTLQDSIAAIIAMKVEDAGIMSESNTVTANQVTMTMIIVLIVVMGLAIALGVILSSIISKPLKRTLTMIQEMGKGHLNTRLKMDSKDEVGQMAKAMDDFTDTLQFKVVKVIQMIAVGDMSAHVVPVDDKDEIAPALATCINNVNALVADANRLSIAAVEGKLDTRADASKHGGDFRKIVEGVNSTLDSVIGPLNVAAEYVDRISKGDIPPKITDKYNGDFNEIKNNLNTCIDAVNALVADANRLSIAAVEGKLDTRADATKHGGDFRKIVEGVNGTLDSVIGPLNVAAEYVDRISKGDIPPKITDKYNGDFNEIKNNLNTCIDAVNALVADANRLSIAAVEGKLDTRADATKHGGDFRKIVEGVNGTLDSVIGPLNVAAEYVDRISKGDIPPKITDKYNGDFNEIKNNLNTCIDAVNALVADANRLSIAAVEGKLDTRADATKHGGDFRKIVEGVNNTLDSVIGPLNVAAEYVDRISKGDIPPKITDKYNGDFNEIKNNLNTCIDAVNALVGDAEMLAKAAVEGKLSTRADASKHGGDFAKIVSGVNNTLDAVIEPVNEASSVLREMAAGSLQTRMMGDYKGDHAEIKKALNSTLDALSDYVNEISSVLSEMANANMDSQITSDYRGDFMPIKEALNLILDSFNQTLSDIGISADQVAAGSRQVSDGSQALSQGATEQASSIEELTASINDIASQTRKNAMSANEANELAVTASENAGTGNAQMQDMLKAMEDINTSSQNISKIIKVIEDIAFQTNMLALNAAVEAARAGQHGKGFAVVAEEVRTLAARSANAAKETTSMIEGSIQKVSAGTRIANDTAEALGKIVGGVTKVANLVSSIATASNDQATGIAQVNQGVEQVSRVIQTNSATAEESAAASEELSSQADLLKEMIGRFHLRQHGGTARVSGADAFRKMLTESREDARKAPGKKKPQEGGKPKISLNDREFGKY